MTDARDNILVYRAANLALKKLASTGQLAAISSTFRNGQQQQQQQQQQRQNQRTRLNAKDRLGVAQNIGVKSRLGFGSPVVVAANGRRQSFSSQRGVGSRRQTLPTKTFPKITPKISFENFQIVAEVDDEDASVYVEPFPKNRSLRFPPSSKNIPLTRTIRNNLAASSSTFSGRTNSVSRDAERNREENDEVVQQNYHSPVFDRLSSPNSKSSTANANSVDGYVVRVTNLSDTVTEDDVEELFSSIGPLISSSLIRPCVGEAVFVRLADAKRAIAEFDKRELDGIAMKCVLVKQHVIEDNEKSNSTAASTKLSKLRAQQPSRLSSSPSTSSTESAMEVDRNLFNQAMFTDKNKPDASGVQFTVKI